MCFVLILMYSHETTCRSTRICYVLRSKAHCPLSYRSEQTGSLYLMLVLLASETYTLLFSPLHASGPLGPRSPPFFCFSSLAVYRQTDSGFLVSSVDSTYVIPATGCDTFLLVINISNLERN
jgi:hypothetical protein